MSSYLAATYFAPSYFSAAGGVVAFGSGGSAVVRDWDVFEDLVGELEATGEFSDVVYLLPGEAVEAAGRNPLAGVKPRGWVERPGGDGGSLIRTVRYELAIVVVDPEPRSRYAWGDRLACLAQNRIDGSSLGGACIPGLSVLRGGDLRDGGGADALMLVLDGEFAYAIDPASGRKVDA
jgi:hypothetical protein